LDDHTKDGPVNKQYPLHTFVHRILIRRLVMVALALAVVLGGVAWLQIRSQITGRIVTVTVDRLAVLRSHYQALQTEVGLDEHAFAEAMDVLAAMQFDRDRGHYIHGVFYHAEAEFYRFHAAEHPLADEARELVDAEALARPPLGSGEQRIMRIQGQPVVRVVLPIANRDGQLTVWLTGVFVLSEDDAQALSREPLLAALAVFAIVLVTTGLLYPVILRLARRLADLSSDLLEANLEMMETLGCAVAKRDSDTDTHNYRVTIYAVRLAEKEGLPVADIQALIKGAFLHDVGKIGIRDDVLLKPGKLSEPEFEVMKTHVDHGMDIVGRAQWLQDALAVVSGHHEKVDGGGYPGRLDGRRIPAVAKIFAIADVFDALSSKRPYKEAMPLERAVGIMVEGRGTHFDVEYLTSFLEIAPALKDQLSELGAEELRAEMRGITQEYFNADLGSLLV